MVEGSEPIDSLRALHRCGQVSMVESPMKRGSSRQVLLIALGVMGMLLSAFADLIGLGHPGFGVWQLSGVVIGSLVAAVGIVQIIFPDNPISVRLFTGIYMTGIFYVGLRPSTFNCIHNKELLDCRNIYWPDIAINTVGFIPLGYLLMLSFGSRQKDRRANLLKSAIIVGGFGACISLFIEVSQYYFISGRASSLFDCISNTLGTFLGIAAYLALSKKPGYGVTR